MGRDRQGRIVGALQLRRVDGSGLVGRLAATTRLQIPSLAAPTQAD